MVVLWAYFKYLKIHLALTYRSIFLRLGAFIQYRTVRHKHCPFFIIFAPDVIFNSFWYLVEVKRNDDFASFCRKINEVLARIDEETRCSWCQSFITWKNWLEVTMHNLEKNISFSWFRNTLNVTVQFFENSETVFFCFKSCISNAH